MLFGWWRVRRLWIPFWEDCMNKVQYCKLPRTMRSCASNYSRNTDSGEEGRLFSAETTTEPDKAERRIDSVDVSRNGKVREIESLFTRDGLAFVSLSKTRHSKNQFHTFESMPSSIQAPLHPKKYFLLPPLTNS